MSISPGNRLFVAIPLLNEEQHLAQLLHCIQEQTFRNFTVCYCVNQPDSWWSDEKHISQCIANRSGLEIISVIKDHPIILIDRSSPGKGWSDKKSGVGWARKTAMDACSAIAGDQDILLSLDADTRFEPAYFDSIMQTFEDHPDAVSLAVPYLHELTDDENLNRAMLRYEIYMRHYAIQLWRIGSPYCFTALGSALAVRMKAYRRIGGMTPMKSGEDFYFLQKLRKYSAMQFWNSLKVYPANRLSDRVLFGTGPALIKGITGDWESYPLYSSGLFNQVKTTIDMFPELFNKDMETPMNSFLKEVFKEENIWEPLRKNNTKEKGFIRACHEKVDALRTLQFLKSNTIPDERQNVENLKELISTYYAEYYTQAGNTVWDQLDFTTSDISILNKIRMLLVSIEENCQINHYQQSKAE